MSATLQFFATAPRGLEELLAAELAALGAAAIKLQPSGVLFQGPLQVGYRACLWSRVAGRVLLELGRGPASDAEELYAAALVPAELLLVDVAIGRDTETVPTVFARGGWLLLHLCRALALGLLIELWWRGRRAKLGR